MKALRMGRSLALLLAGGIALSACDDSDSGSASNGSKGCVGTFGADFTRAFEQDPNAEPLNATNLNLERTPSLEPIDVPC